MTEPGKRGGGFRPGSAADRVVKKRVKKLLAGVEEGTMARQLRPLQSRPAAISSVAHVEAIFDQIAVIFRQHGKPDPRLGGETLYLGDHAYRPVAASPLGPYETLFGPTVCLHRRPTQEAKFGWLKRIDIRTGSPTAMLELLTELRESTK